MTPRGNERGTSAVEFAIIISLVFIVLFGIIQFGIAFNRYQAITGSAREGARLGSLSNTTVDSIRQRAKDSLSIINPANFSSAYACPALGTEQGCIEVSQENTGSPGTYTVLTNGGAVPCDSAHSTFTLRVLVRYKMLITIPLWASPSVNAEGNGVFKCE